MDADDLRAAHFVHRGGNDSGDEVNLDGRLVRACVRSDISGTDDRLAGCIRPGGVDSEVGMVELVDVPVMSHGLSRMGGGVIGDSVLLPDGNRGMRGVSGLECLVSSDILDGHGVFDSDVGLAELVDIPVMSHELLGMDGGLVGESVMPSGNDSDPNNDTTLGGMGEARYLGVDPCTSGVGVDVGGSLAPGDFDVELYRRKGKAKVVQPEVLSDCAHALNCRADVSVPSYDSSVSTEHVSDPNVGDVILSRGGDMDSSTGPAVGSGLLGDSGLLELMHTVDRRVTRSMRRGHHSSDGADRLLCPGVGGVNSQSRGVMHTVSVDDLPASVGSVGEGSTDLHPNRRRVRLPKRQRRFSRCGDIPRDVWVLPDAPDCEFCLARRFNRECDGFCCASGKIYLKALQPMVEIFNMFTVDITSKGCRFRRCARTYNNQLALTSIGMRTQSEFCQNINGTYTVRVNGVVTHRLDPYDARVVLEKRLQLFFLDTADGLGDEILLQYDIDRNITHMLLGLLSNNPYFRFFRGLRDWENLHNLSVVLRCDPRLDCHLYNVPRVDQVAAIWDETSEQSRGLDRDIRVYTVGGESRTIHYHYGCYDPLQYPLLFHHGEPGWHTGIRRLQAGHAPGAICPRYDSVDPRPNHTADDVLQNEARVYSSNVCTQQQVSCREYTCYRAQMRVGENNIVIHSGRLGQQYAIDSYIKIETQRLDYHRLEQRQLDMRMETLQGLSDALNVDGITDGDKVGRRIVLPSSFIRGPRDMMQRYVNAMALVQKYGKPDIFLTMTCNPKWPEIQRELFPGEVATDRPDLVARVFRAKLEDLKDELVNQHLFGEIAAYVYVVEFEKRGLPHVHWILMLKDHHRFANVAEYDKIISAEIPSDDHPFLKAYVVSHMLHGPCGDLNPTNVCMQNGQCRNKYPRDYSETTVLVENSYPRYMRRDDGVSVCVRNQFLDNRYVVPYSPYLLAKFNCHINVEICTNVRLVKYLYKYIYKGHDKIAYNVVDGSFDSEYDEIKEYQKGRWVCAIEAYWRIFGFSLYDMHPSVIVLPVHLPGGQFVTYHRSKRVKDIVDDDFSSRTMLTEFFKMNMSNSDAIQLNLTYREFPQYFVWNRQGRVWTLRKRGGIVSRLSVVDPTEGERYFLRILLINLRGPTSYDDLLRYDGGVASSFREAALLKGFVQVDTYAETCMEEAAAFQMAPSLRCLFAILLVNYSPPDPLYLFDKFYRVMSEDLRLDKRLSAFDVRRTTLTKIDGFLVAQGRSINDYLPSLSSDNVTESEKLTREIEYESGIDVPQNDARSIDRLNSRQQIAFDSIVNKFDKNEAGCFFIDGPGGTGKTYLYRALLAYFHLRKHIALAVATSGVAASLFPGGRTAHSRFKLPLEFETHEKIQMSKQCSLARLLVLSKIIIWDEATMDNKKAVEALDDLLRFLMDVPDVLFGGKIIVFGGDFRQTLPIVAAGTRDGMIDACLISSYVWPRLTKFRLTMNVRAESDVEFSNFLLRVGDGTEPYEKDDCIRLPREIIFDKHCHVDPLMAFVHKVFPRIDNVDVESGEYVTRAILTPKNDCVDELNNLLISKMPGLAHVYTSSNKADTVNDDGQYEEYLNSITGGGLPAHELVLKVNCPIMLLRNLNPVEGLCNGTRLICRQLGKHFIGAEIISGDHCRKHVFIPRIPLEYSNTKSCNIAFKRTQFPVRPCFAMTINKSQGQTLDYVGVYLPTPVFSHGQLYVALSRARAFNCVQVYVCSDTDDNHGGGSVTRNVVYKEIYEQI